MNKLFVSKIDNKTFTDEKDLIRHLLDNYSMVDQSEGESIKILKSLQSAFPFAKVNVNDSSEPAYGKYLVNMNWKEYNGDFSFYIGENSDYDYYLTSFENVDKAIEYYNLYIEQANEITTKLQDKYNPSSITITQMYEGDMNSDNSISFELKINGKEYYERYNFDNVVDFVNSFSGYFDTVFEGEPLLERDHHSGYDKEVTVNGVPVKNIMERAKRVRIEILELR